jgi:hypothetical protein
MNRTVFIIDGFNLYHSTRDASNDLGGQSTKWLDVRALCESYLYTISKTARLEDVFTSLLSPRISKLPIRAKCKDTKRSSSV